jgi:uncharacterized cupin superfamily protein
VSSSSRGGGVAAAAAAAAAAAPALANRGVVRVKCLGGSDRPLRRRVRASP